MKGARLGLLLISGIVAWAARAAPASGPVPPASVSSLPPVSVTSKAVRDPQVEKSYRRMLRGMDLFEQRRAALAPNAELRFRLLPRKASVDLSGIELYVLGTRTEIRVPVAPDQRFALPRDARAAAENAVVTPDRPARSLTWRADVRTPGLAPGTRRLGDLRLECYVGIAAGLVSDSPSFIARMVRSLADTPLYCDRPDAGYLFFAERALFGVTLVHGARREVLPVDRLYAAAIDDARLAAELPFCDCELLLDRAYFVPLHDRQWPDDTRVVLEFMEQEGAQRGPAR